MKTIEKVFAWRLRELRGKRTQQQVSDETKIPLRTYQTMEDGRIPKKKANLEAIARYYNVPETSLFIDPELSSGGGAHAESPTVSALTKIIEQQDQRIKELEKHAENPIVSRLLKLSPKDQKTISDLMLSLEWQRDELAKVNEAAKLPKLVKKRG